jgi:hypothetical protein
MRAEQVLMAIAAVLGTGCTDSTSGCDSEWVTQHSLDEICRLSGNDAGCTAPTTCEPFCQRVSSEPISCRILGNASTKNDEPFLECTSRAVCKGRRPAGLEQSEPSDTFLEAASVVAFARLARELRLLRAPRRLVRGARRSRRDEIRHTRMMRAVERKPVRVEVAQPHARSVLQIALENEIEGCVRETYGAAIARWQAAKDRFYERIARDEARHAVLAHEVSRFLRARLSPTERAFLDRARDEAIDELVRNPSHEIPADVSRAWLALLRS